MLSQNMADSRMAVIYARVSDPRQKIYGDGLRSQQARCREFATYRSYEVTAIFEDDMTGGSVKRPGLDQMLKYLRKHRNHQPVVIIDDITRFARDIVSHWTLRDMIKKAGGQLESPSMQFGETSDAILHENMMASMSQHQRQKNAEQTQNRMRGRLLNGYWVFQAPVGYRYERVNGHSKLLIPDPRLAVIVTEALEGYATGRFSSQVEVGRFLEKQPGFPKVGTRQIVRPMTVTRLLKQPLYAGMVEHPVWGISLRKGQHKALISLETFQRIQERLDGNAHAPKRQDLHRDFPLRGLVACAECGRPFTAGWSKGKYRHYAYYHCQNKECECHGKSIPKETLEGEFAKLLATIGPSHHLCDLMHEVFTDNWNQIQQRGAAHAKALAGELRAIQKSVDDLLRRILDTQSPAVIKAYEQRIEALEIQKLMLAEQATKSSGPKGTFEEKFELSMQFLRNLRWLWDSGKFEWQRMVLKLTFSDHLRYCRKSGYRTPNLSRPFKMLASFLGSDCQMVPPERESLNSLFREMADWEHQLQHLKSIEFKDHDTM